MKGRDRVVAEEAIAGATKAGMERVFVLIQVRDSDTFFIICIDRLYEVQRTVAYLC